MTFVLGGKEMSKYKTINTKACCCNFYAEVLEKFKSLPKEKQIEILKNLFKEEEKTNE